MAFSATRAAFEGFRLIRARPGVILGWALFYAVALGVIIGGSILIFGATALADLLSGQDREYDSLEEILPFLQALAAFLGFLLVSLSIVAAIQLGAAYRAVLRPQDAGFAYMRFGADELRQVLLMWVFFFIYLVIWGAPLAAVVALHASEFMEEAGIVALYIVWFAAALGVSVFVGVRLSLAGPMTLAKRRLLLTSSWSLTRGRFWPLLGMYVLTLIFAIILSTLTDALGQALMGAVGLAAFDLHDPDSYDLPAWTGAMIAGGVAYAVVYVLSQAVTLAVFYAPQAAAFRDILAEQAPASDLPPPEL